MNGLVYLLLGHSHSFVSVLLHVKSDIGVAHQWTCLFVGRTLSFICFCAKCVIYCLISYTDCSY
jgi:hypothetical protein